MSTLSSFGGGSGGGIKNVQRGTNTWSDGNTSFNITISEVDLSKSFLNVTYTHRDRTSANPSNDIIRCRLSSSTNINLYRFYYQNYAYISWEVIEYA